MSDESSVATESTDDLFADIGEMEDVQTKADKKAQAHDDIGKALLSALARYNAGQYRAAIEQAGRAINSIALRHKVHGGASW